MHSNPIDSIRSLLEQRRREGGAKIVPFLSFVLTHLALTAFLIATFFVHTLEAKVLVTALGILLIASEWIYTIVISIRWKLDIAARLLAEEDSRQALQAAQRVTYETRIDVERQRWQGEIARRRLQREAKQRIS